MNSASATFRTLTLVSIWVGALLLSACSSPSVPQSLSASDILKKAQHATIQDTTFDLSLSTSLLNGSKPFTGSGEFTAQPQRFELVLSVVVSGATYSAHTIVDGSDVYSKVMPSSPDTKWAKSPANSGNNSSTLELVSLVSRVTVRNPTLVGVETVNGIQTYHIKGSYPLSSTPTTSSVTITTNQEDVWIRLDNFYPQKVQVNEVSSGTGGGSTTIIAIFKTWNTGITIVVPSPSEVTTSPT